MKVARKEMDSDRGRRRQRRRPRKDRESVGRKDSESRETTPAPSAPVTPTRTPIILAKPDRHETPNDGNAQIKQGDKLTITVKTREDAPSASHSEQSMPGMYRLQKPLLSSIIPHSESTPQSLMAPPPEISRSLKLVDESLMWCDMGIDMLLDQSEFMVIGIVGTQGVGKSSILSHLVGSLPDDPYKSFVFRPQNSEARSMNSHQTCGIDMYVTTERVIYLDTQPVLSSSVLFAMIDHEKKMATEYSSAENCHEMQSLQIVSFLYTVCNVVLVCVDWFADLFFLRFLQTAEMVKPPTPSTSHENTKDVTEYYPHLVFLLNKAEPKDFSRKHYTAMENTIDKMFTKSRLKYNGNIRPSVGKLLKNCGLNGRSVNLFLLPKFEQSVNQPNGDDPVYSLMSEYQGHPSYDHMIEQLKGQLYAIPRDLLTHTTLSEKNWFHYAARTWEGIRKFPLLAEYNRLLP